MKNGANDINEVLIFASREGYLEIVKYLSEHVEDINTKNNALMIASSLEN